jgi:hypothetical protein
MGKPRDAIVSVDMGDDHEFLWVDVVENESDGCRSPSRLVC